MTSVDATNRHHSTSLAGRLALFASNGAESGVSAAIAGFEVLLGAALDARAEAGPRNWSIVKRKPALSGVCVASAEGVERRVLACALQLRLCGKQQAAAVLERLLDSLLCAHPVDAAVLATLWVLCAVARLDDAAEAEAPALGKMARAMLDEEAAAARQERDDKFHFTNGDGLMEPSLQGLLDDPNATSFALSSKPGGHDAGMSWMSNSCDEVSEFFTDTITTPSDLGHVGPDLGRSDLFGALVQRTIRKSSKMYREAAVPLSVPMLHDGQEPDLPTLQQPRHGILSRSPMRLAVNEAASTCTTEESDDDAVETAQDENLKPQVRQRLTRTTPQQFEQVLAIANGFGKATKRPFACEEKAVFLHLSRLSRGCPMRGGLISSQVPFGVTQAAYRQYADEMFGAFKRHSDLEDILRDCDEMYAARSDLQSAVGQAYATGLRLIMSFLDTSNLRLEHSIATSNSATLKGLVDEKSGNLLLCGFRNVLQPYLASLGSTEQLLGNPAILPTGSCPWQTLQLLCKELSWLQLLSPDVLLRTLASSDSLLHQKSKIVFVFLLLVVVAKPLFADVRRHLFQCNATPVMNDDVSLHVPSFLYPDGRAKCATALHLLVELRQSTFWSGAASISPKDAMLFAFPASVQQFRNHRKLQSIIAKRLRSTCKVTSRILTRHWSQAKPGRRRSSANTPESRPSESVGRAPAPVAHRRAPIVPKLIPESEATHRAPTPRNDTFEPQFLLERTFDSGILRQAKTLLMERYGEKMIEAERRKAAADWRRRELLTLPRRRQQLGQLFGEEAQQWAEAEQQPTPPPQAIESPSASSMASTKSVIRVEQPELHPSAAAAVVQASSPTLSRSSRSTCDVEASVDDHAHVNTHNDNSHHDLQAALPITITRSVGDDHSLKSATDVRESRRQHADHRRFLSMPLELAGALQDDQPAAGVSTGGHARGTSLSGIRVLQPSGGFSSINLADVHHLELRRPDTALRALTDTASIADTEAVDSVLMGFEVVDVGDSDTDGEEEVISMSGTHSDAAHLNPEKILDSLQLEWDAAQTLSPVHYPDILLNVLADHSPDNASLFQPLQAMTEMPIECTLDQTARRTVALQCRLIEAATLGYLLEEVKVLQHLEVLQRTLLLTPRGDVITSFVPMMLDEVLQRMGNAGVEGAAVLHPTSLQNMWLGLARDVVCAGQSVVNEAVLEYLSVEIQPKGSGRNAMLVRKIDCLFGDTLFGGISINYRPPQAVSLVLHPETLESIFAVHKTLIRALQVQAAGTLVWKEMKPRRGSMQHVVAARTMSMLYGLCANARTVFISYLSNELIGAHGWLSKRLRTKASIIQSPAALRKFVDTYAARLCRSTLTLDATADNARQLSSDRVVIRASEAFERLRVTVLRCLQLLFKHAQEASSPDDCVREVLQHGDLLHRAVADLHAKLRVAVDATSASTQVSLQALLALIGFPGRWKITT